MIAGIYVIEFQKRGLLHAHILIFFIKDCKPHMVENVDRMINAKLPNLGTKRLAHETIARCMMHGPCGTTFPNAPCMEDGKCKKQYPHKFQSKTVTNVNGYPIYQRRNTMRTILVHGIELDNCWVVHTMSIYRPNTMHTSTLRSATTFMQSNICSSTFTKDMIVQLLRSHATTTMPLKGMWSKPMKLKNISIVAMYMHQK
jgi:hypothetical protein